METIGNRIKKKRKERGYSQEDLAKKVNKSKQVISNWERGYSKPVDDDLLSLTTALEVSSDYLLGIKIKNHTELSDNDREIVDSIRRLPEFQKSAVKTLVDSMIEKNKG